MAENFKDLVQKTATEKSKEFASERTIELLQEEIKHLQKQLDSFEVVAYAQTNEKDDLYDLSLRNNPYLDQSKMVPLYKFNEKGE